MNDVNAKVAEVRKIPRENNRLGLLINFHSFRLKDGVWRIVNNL